MEILINFMVLVLIPWLVLQSEYSSLQTQKLDCNQWQVSVLCKAGAQQEKTRIRNVIKKKARSTSVLRWQSEFL